MSLLREILSGMKVLLMDGAMGTMLADPLSAPRAGGCEQLNLADPDKVSRVHKAYWAAGARCLLTNTFQANTTVLGGVKPVLQSASAALQLARSATENGGYVIGDIGPVERRGPEVLAPTFEALSDVDAFLFETWSDLAALEESIALLRKMDHCRDRPLLLSFAFRASPELQTFHGYRPEECAHFASQVGAHCLGANCGMEIGSVELLEIVRLFRAVSPLPIMVRPNAGTPFRDRNGDWIYPKSASNWARDLTSLVKGGVRLIGGCCGTTPEHIEQLRQVLRGSA